MIHIERLRLRLPSHLGPHAESIARRIGATLAAAPVDQVGRVERCPVPPLTAPPHLGPAGVAEIAARGIRRQLGSRRP